MSYKDFRTAAYSELRSAGIRSHGERHAYAQGRYETLGVGVSFAVRPDARAAQLAIGSRPKVLVGH
ncbi:hypothetical protein KAM333_41160 [Aeromonas caviae]|nr:hypothetical protein KAM333_41160 [Aeromonas caviae]